MDFSGFNWGEIVVAALSAVVICGIWYGPLFGTRWRTLNHLSDGYISLARIASLYGLAFVLYFFVALMMSFFIEIAMMLGSGALEGGLFGGFLAVVFFVPAFSVNYIFARRPLSLYAIDSSCVVIQFAVMGAIMGGWV